MDKWSRVSRQGVPITAFRALLLLIDYRKNPGDPALRRDTLAYVKGKLPKEKLLKVERMLRRESEIDLLTRMRVPMNAEEIGQCLGIPPMIVRMNLTIYARKGRIHAFRQGPTTWYVTI